MTTADWPAEIADRITGVRALPNRGGQGILYSGRWYDGTEVVVKQLHHSQPSAADVWRWWTEAARRCAGVLPLLAAASAGGRGFEVTPWQPAGSLRDHAGQPPVPLPTDQAETVLRQLSLALDQLHNVLVHGDVKPANVLVLATDPLRVCLTDFGSARAYPREFGDRDWTPQWAAPERFRGENRPAGDWWGLGMTLLELVQGRHPFWINEIAGWLPDAWINTQLDTQPVPIDEHVPARWRLLLRGLLTWSPARRWRYPQVRQWLAGQSPAVDERVGPEPPPGPPFEFAGTEVHHPVDLAAAMAANWPAATTLVRGQDRDRLQDWAGRVSTPLAAQLRRDLARTTQARRPVDRRVCELLVRLDPAAPPTFRGHPVDRTGLAGLATAAINGDDTARATLTALRDTGSLRVLSQLAGQAELARLARHWRHAPRPRPWLGLPAVLAAQRP